MPPAPGAPAFGSPCPIRPPRGGEGLGGEVGRGRRGDTLTLALGGGGRGGVGLGGCGLTVKQACDGNGDDRKGRKGGGYLFVIDVHTGLRAPGLRVTTSSTWALAHTRESVSS